MKKMPTFNADGTITDTEIERIKKEKRAAQKKEAQKAAETKPENEQTEIKDS